MVLVDLNHNDNCIQMNTGENLSIILITYNRLEHTKKTIESLRRTVPDAHLFIYDNASNEELQRYICLHLNWSEDNYEVVLANRNRGWGSAINESLQLSKKKGDYLLLSNNDVEYSDGWLDQAIALYEKYPKLGLLGLWKHTSHGIKEDLGDLIVKDQMPAVAWLFKPKVLEDIGHFAEKGPCETKGGNGEDVDYCIKTEQKGYWVAGPSDDLAIHLDGY